MQTSLKTTVCSIYNLDKLLRLISGEAIQKAKAKFEFEMNRNKNKFFFEKCIVPLKICRYGKSQ